MSKAIAVRDGDRVRTYPLKEFSDFTIADWRAMCLPPIEEGDPDAFYETIRRYVGIPKATLRKLPMAEMDRLTTALAKMQQEAEEARVASDKVVETWATDGPKEITHEGITYTVPQDLERDTVFGQWVDMDAALEGATHEPEVMAAICACLLVEKGGEYEGFHKTVERFDSLPVRTAMALTAFFLQRSERLTASMLRCMQRRMMRLQQGSGQTEAPLTNDGGGGVA